MSHAIGPDTWGEHDEDHMAYGGLLHGRDATPSVALPLEAAPSSKMPLS